MPVRFNTILLQDGINSKEEVLKMISFAKEMNINWIRFSKLQFEKKGLFLLKMYLMELIMNHIMKDVIKVL